MTVFLGTVIFKEGGHMLRTYSGIVGVSLALWAIGALVGVWGLSPFRTVLLLGTSLIFLYAGFVRLNAMELRIIVGGMGILYLFSAALLIVIWAWFNTPDNDPELPKIFLRGTIGILSLLCAKFLPQREEKRERTPEDQPYLTKEMALPEAQVSVAVALMEEDHTE